LPGKLAGFALWRYRNAREKTQNRVLEAAWHSGSLQGDGRMTDNQKVDARHDAIRQARLAAALRENLKRRKVQSRGRVVDDHKTPSESAIEPTTATPEGQG
jgi:hypothetical protein